MNRIKEFRVAAGMKQSELAELTHAKQSTVSGWESGRREPDFETLSIMASTFGCTIDDLLGYEKTPTVEQNGERSMLDITALSPENRDRLEDYLHLLLDSQNK